MELKTARLNLVLAPSQIKRLDDWRKQHQIRSRCDAIRQLIENGIEPSAQPLPR